MPDRPDDLVARARRHKKYVRWSLRSGQPETGCHWCGQPWPCDARQLADRVEALEATHYEGLIECQRCEFAFEKGYTDADGGLSCPACRVEALEGDRERIINVFLTDTQARGVRASLADSDRAALLESLREADRG